MKREVFILLKKMRMKNGKGRFKLRFTVVMLACMMSFSMGCGKTEQTGNMKNANETEQTETRETTEIVNNETEQTEDTFKVSEDDATVIEQKEKKVSTDKNSGKKADKKVQKNKKVQGTLVAKSSDTNKELDVNNNQQDSGRKSDVTSNLDENKKPDTDEDKKPDATPDTDENKKPDVTPDTDEDKKPDVTPDTDEDKKPDVTPGADEDKKPDATPGADEDKKPDATPDTDEDKKPDVTPDTDEDKKSDVTPDTGEDKKPDATPGTDEKMDPQKDPVYHLVWEENFDEDTLDRSVWNVELHDPGWVNSELQAYVDSEENIFIKDGNLIIQPVKTEKDGKVSYTSGRVNTQGKKDFKYGYFECRAKVPQGNGYLPAFWMMPTNENLYGQWPKCGEIDIMEVMGQQTDKLYGTIHYGEPHAESQGTKILEKGNFADEYHTFACEWEPGSIKWYVDGILYHEENDWYSTTKNVGTVAYPAPFDQPFYMILNVAVGGSWVGNVDDTTPFDERAQLAVDYVRVYQKDSYDENVEKPVKDVVLRAPDENGNYINNGDFSVKEDLTDDKDWKFLTANGGVATAEIADNVMKITTEDAGTVDYSVQLVQAAIPLKKGAIYEVSYEAKASENRKMNTAVKAPDRSYMAYMSENADLTTDWKKYTYSFKMTEDNDANGRLEYNMGAAGSTAAVEIRNVAVKMTKDANPNEVEEKTVLANGSLVYNGEFQEGANRLKFWEVSDSNAVSVTNINNERELHAVVNHTAENPLTVVQTGLAFTDGTEYELSFKARGTASLKVNAAGAEESYTLTDENQTYRLKIKNECYTDKNLVFTMTGEGEIYLDSVMLVEASLIKNGSFNAGLSGYEFYQYADGMASIVVDSQTEDNAADITINNTGNTDWYIQLKQNNVVLEKDQWYRLKFDVKSNLVRKIMYAIQRDGSADNDWTPYTGSKIIELAGANEYETVICDFKMVNDTDEKAILSFTLGAVGGDAIDMQHRICFDNISLDKIDAPVIEPSKPAGENILTGLWGNIAGGEIGTYTAQDGKFDFTLNNSGTNNWDIQVANQQLSLINGKEYEIKFKITSSIDRIFKLGFRDPSNSYKGFYDDITLKANETKEYVVNTTWNEETTTTGEFVLLLGTPEGAEALDAHTITVEEISATEIVK